MDSPIPDWDYIIVGAGSAGCVLANRLSADPRKTVLLLEAGESDRNPLQRIPLAGVMLNYGHQRRDWRYETEPDPSRHDRRETWPRGKLLGGTSSLNGMIYVRGAPEDFDHWASLGNDGWRYEDVLPIYKQLEDHEYSRSSHPLSHQYGSGGPLKVRQLKGVHPLARAFVSACRDLGIPENDHYNAGDQEGACILTASHSGRIRSSSSQSFLQPARHRPNLHIVTDTLVLRVLLEGKKAVGVMAERKGEGQREYRGRTVILSGGAVNSPQLLLLSGIGPAAHLQRMGIAVRHDLPGVGRNLQDHPGCAVLAKVNVPTPNTNVIARMKDGLNWLLLGKGLFTTAAAQALVFAKSSAGLRHPDIQINLMPLAFTVEKGRGVEFIDSTMTLLPNISHPKSRGFLELRSPDPHAPPSIQPNMLGAEEDVRALAVAARLGQQLLKTDAFKPYVEREILPGQEFATDAEWENYLRENATSCAHQSGTCKMGSDVMAVVDSRLKVHGIEGLRVADASIMPTVPSGNTNGVCMMIGGKAAQMILRESN
jgi:choline dehydrogenase